MHGFVGRAEIDDCGRSGRPRRPQKPFQKVGGFAPDLLVWLLGPPGPPRSSKSTIAGRPQNHVLETRVQRLNVPHPSLPHPFVLGFVSRAGALAAVFKKGALGCIHDQSLDLAFGVEQKRSRNGSRISVRGGFVVRSVRLFEPDPYGGVLGPSLSGKWPQPKTVRF